MDSGSAESLADSGCWFGSERMLAVVVLKEALPLLGPIALV